MLIENQNQQPQVSEKSSFNKFLSTIKDFFTPGSPEQIAAERAKQQALKAEEEKLLQVRIKVQEYIDKKNFKYVFTASEHGYVFTRRQSQQLSDIFIDYLNKQEIDDARKMVNLGYKLNDDDMATLFMNASFIKKHLEDIFYFYHGRVKGYHHEIKAGEIRYTHDNLCKQFFDYQQDINNTKKLFEIWTERMEKYVQFGERNKDQKMESEFGLLSSGEGYSGYIAMFSYFTLNHKTALADSDTYHNIINYMEQIRDDAKKGQVDDYYIIVHKAYDDKQCIKLVELLRYCVEKKVDLFFKNELQELIAQTRGISMSERVGEGLNKKAKQQHYNVNTLPQEALNQLQEIEECYTNLQAHTSKMSQEQKFNIDNLLDKRLPEVLQKYFNIDEEYRTTLQTVKGETPKDLLLSSLNSINEHIHALEKSINEQHMQELQVSKRYLNSMNKS